MKGLSAEPGERKACAMSIEPERVSERKSGEPTWARNSPVALSTTRMAVEQSRIEPREALAGQRLERGLQARIDRKPDHTLARRRLERLLRRMGRHRREGPPLGRNGLGLGVFGFRDTDEAAFARPIEHACAGTFRRLRETVGPARFRRLRESYEECGLSDREPLRFLAEIGEARGAQAFDIASVRCKPQVEIEHVASLVRRLFDFDRADHLAQLGRDRTIRPRLEKARHLHGEGRSARYDPAVQDHLQHRSRERERVDPAMLREAAVLVGAPACRDSAGRHRALRSAVANARSAW